MGTQHVAVHPFWYGKGGVPVLAVEDCNSNDGNEGTSCTVTARQVSAEFALGDAWAEAMPHKGPRVGGSRAPVVLRAYVAWRR